MTRNVTISLDVMGGDHGAQVVIPGAALASVRHPDIRFALYGNEAEITPLLEEYPRVKERASVFHTDVFVRMDDKPSHALRHGRGKSSMWMAIQAVRDGTADVCVSAGNTGALMAMARFCLRSMAEVERPSIAAIWPTTRGESIVLDMGATIGADARQLIDMAVLGSALARVLHDIERPTVGLLNIGVEEVKGLEEVRQAGTLLRELDLPGLQYCGFVEGNDIGKGVVDVVVTEGFSGNIALKTAEGTARQIGDFLKSAISRSWRSKLGYLLAKPAFDALKAKLDPSNSNGGVFLGLNGIVIKSHGGTDAHGFAAAVDLAYDMVKNDILTKIGHDIGQLHSNHPELVTLSSKAP